MTLPTKKPKSIPPLSERIAKADKILTLFATGQRELARGILAAATEDQWLFEQLLAGCSVWCGRPSPSRAIENAISNTMEWKNEKLIMLEILIQAHGKISPPKIPNIFEITELDFDLDENNLEWFGDISNQLPNFKKHTGQCLLQEVVHLSDTAAKGLIKHKGNSLSLPAVASLSVAGAEALGTHGGQSLSLDGLTSLSDCAAEALGNHKGRFLELSELTNLSEVAANGLSKFRGSLYLQGLPTLSNKAAEALSNHSGSLDLSGLTELSERAAVAMGNHKGRFLGLTGLKRISDSVAMALSMHMGYLDLGGLTALSDRAAKAFGKHLGNLMLGQLNGLSLTSAKALAKHKGDLSLPYQLRKKVNHYKGSRWGKS